MASIIRYLLVSDAYTEYRLREPNGHSDGPRPVTLCEIDGYVYVSVPDGVVLPEQPEQVAIEPVALNDDLATQIKDLSPQVRTINDRVVEMIRGRYSITDEIKMLRLAPSPETSAYNDYVEDCRAWGHAQKAALGL